MKWNRKKVLGILLIIPIILVVGWFALYDFGIRHLTEHARDFTANLQQKGLEVSYDELVGTATPFKIEGIFRNVKIRDAKGFFQLTGPEISVSFRPWNYKEITVDLSGKPQLSIPSLDNLELAQLDLYGATAILSLDSQNQLKKLQFFADHISPVKGKVHLPVAFHVVKVTFKDISNPLSSSGKISMKVLGIDDVLNVKEMDHPLTFELDYKLSGLPETAKIQSLALWRDLGGVIDINHLLIDWEVLAVEGKGSLSLDEKMRPLGAFSAKFTGYDNTLNLLVKAGYIKEKAASAVAFALTLMAGDPALGKKEVSIPVTLQNGAVKVGPARLMKLKPLE